MFDMNICFNDIAISSVQKADIIIIQEWLNTQETYNEVGSNKPLDLEEFYQRFIEYYMSESEIFLKIVKGNQLIGVFKGRVEFKNPNEVFIWCFILDGSLRNAGLGSNVLNNILEYFKNGFGISSFSTGIMVGNPAVKGFWNKNGFKLLRISEGFFTVEGRDVDMLILKRQDGKNVY